jgi:hypothetical protein
MTMTPMSALDRPDRGRFPVTHGESLNPTPEYDAWHAMKQRCLNPRNKNFARYGGRGISMCDRWMKYENFLEDMGRKPSPAHSIDRINNNGNYEPQNCRWATRSEQQQNKRVGILLKTNTSGHAGVSRESKTGKWEAYHWIKNKKIGLGRFTSFDGAVEARKRWERSR